MSLEKRIVKRWQQWWREGDKQFEPSEKIMKGLIDVALEEVQRGMVEPRFTTREAIAVEHALDMLHVATKESFPTSNETKLVVLRNLVTPEVLSALGKIQSHLQDIHDAQQMVMGFMGTDTSSDKEVQQ